MMKLDQLNITQLNKLKEELSNFFEKRYNNSHSFYCMNGQFIGYNNKHNGLILRRNLFIIETGDIFKLRGLWLKDNKEKYDLFLLEVIGNIFLSYGVDEITFNYGLGSYMEGQGIDYMYNYKLNNWFVIKKY